MKIFRFTFPGILLLTVIAFQACKGIHDVEITDVSGFELKGMEDNNLRFAANIGVHNPSAIGFRISEINLKAIVDGNFLGTLNTIDRIKIPARSDSTYRLTFTLKFNNILTSASTLYNLSRQKQAKVEMQGYVKARSGFATRKVDVSENRIIDIPSKFD
jgi:LEA14-like dessication related protein